jgi:hypothetical protein
LQESVYSVCFAYALSSLFFFLVGVIVFWYVTIHIKIEDVKHVSGGGYRRVFIYLTIYASALLLLIGYLLDLGMESANHNSIKF